METNPMLEDMRRIERGFKKLKALNVIIGVQAADGMNVHGNSASADDHMLMVAAVHEYGCTIKVTPKMRAYLHRAGLHLKKTTTHIHIPERSFIRASHDAGQAILSNTAKQAVDDMMHGNIDAKGVAEALGKAAVEITTGMLGADAKPITPFAAKRRKKSTANVPLHDTRDLFDHITYHIEGGGG
jgi:hypothetical protein